MKTTEMDKAQIRRITEDVYYEDDHLMGVISDLELKVAERLDPSVKERRDDWTETRKWQEIFRQIRKTIAFLIKEN
jgi:hypothetical protein